MSTKPLIVNTLEELTNLAVKEAVDVADTTYRRTAAPRYALSWRGDYVWADPQAGSEFEKLSDSLPYIPYGEPDYAEQRETLKELRPPEKYVRTWRLNSGLHYKPTIELSDDLATQIDAVWTKKRSGYGKGVENTGQLTLLGLVKRLCKDTKALDARIAAEVARRDSLNQLQLRNRQRNKIANALAALEQSLAEADALRGEHAKGTREFSADTYTGKAVADTLGWYGDLQGLREALVPETLPDETTPVTE